jgi:hypothetical protein
MRRITVLCVLGLLVATAGPSMASSVVVGNPELTHTVSADTFHPNEQVELRVVTTNDGRILEGGPSQFESRVQTARSVRMEVLEGRIDAPIDVNSGTASVGQIGPGGVGEFAFDLEIGDAEPGTYTVPVRVRYRYARAVTFDSTGAGAKEIRYQWDDIERTVNLRIRIEESARFDVTTEGVDDLFAGGTGRLSLAVENTGTRTAANASVRLETGAAGLFFGSAANPQPTTSAFVRSLAPGERRRVTVQIGATDDVAPGEYPIDAVVAYRNENDIGRRSEALTTGVTVRPKRTFAIEDLTTRNVRVDESEATISGRIVNTGGGETRNVVVRMRDAGPVTPTNGEAAVGTLAPGEAAPVSFTVAIAGDAEPGTNSFAFDVEYENADGDVRTAPNPVRKTVTIEESRDRFEVSRVTTNVTPGGTARLTAVIRYVGDEPVSAVEARLFTADPLSSSDDGAHLGRLAPGETVRATFRVSATGQALPKEYGSAIQLRYDETDGDTRFTDSHTIGVTVNEPDGGPPTPLVVAGAVVLLLVVGAGTWYRRRNE